MNPISSLCLVIILSFCIFQTQADLVTQTCATTRYKDLCENTLRADPSSKTGDIHVLAKIALRAAAKKLKSIQGQIDKQIKSTTDKYTLQALNDCAENYDGAGEQISDSLTAIESKRYDDVNIWVTAAMSDADSCEEGFKPGTSKLTKVNEKFGQLCSNVLAISNQARG